MTHNENMLKMAEQLWHALRKDAVGAPGVLGIFEGSMTKVYQSTKISMSHYSKLTP